MPPPTLTGKKVKLWFPISISNQKLSELQTFIFGQTASHMVIYGVVPSEGQQ